MRHNILFTSNSIIFETAYQKESLQRFRSRKMKKIVVLRWKSMMKEFPRKQNYCYTIWKNEPTKIGEIISAMLLMMKNGFILVIPKVGQVFNILESIHFESKPQLSWQEGYAQW